MHIAGPAASPAYTQTVQYTPQPSPSAGGHHASDAEINRTADEILATGDRFLIADDYDSRAVRFAQEMEHVDADSQARLMQTLLEKDSGALHSWLKLDIVDRMQNEGRITQDQYTAISEGFAQAYNDGAIRAQDAETFLQTHWAQDFAPGHAQDQVNRMREFLAASDSAAMHEFREDFATHLLDRGADGSGAHTAGLAMQIAADSGDANMAARVFASIAPDKQDAALAAIGESSIGFENSKGGDVDGLRNPLAVLIDSVAQQPSTQQWNDVAVDIARYAESSSDDIFYDFYEDTPIPEVAESMTNLLAGNQGDAVLTALTAWETRGVAGAGGHAQQYGQNAIELGNVLRITAFNPDNPNADAAMSAVQEWAQMRRDLLAGVDRSDYPPGLDISTARQQLGMLGGAAFDAVQQMKIDQDNRAAATEQLVGFVVDLAVSAVPGGGKISSLVADGLKATFGNRPAVDRLIDQALSGGDTLTGSALDQLKKDIAGALNGDTADLETLRVDASQFVASAVLSGLPTGANGSHAHADIVASHTQVVQTEIQDIRGN